MGFNTSALTAYVEQNAFDLITKAVFGAKSISMFSLQTGIKSTASINIVDTDVVFQTGGTCGFNASGTTTLSQRNLTVGKIKVHEALCPKDLEAFYIQTSMRPGTPQEIPFEQLYMGKKLALIQAQMETAVWQGDTGSGNDNLNKFDGLIKIIEAASGPVAATSQAAINATTVRGIFEDIYSKIPVAVLDKEDLVAFCSWDAFRTLILKLTADNLFHYTTDTAASTGEIFYPGTGLRVVAVNGLNGTGRIFAGQMSNFYYGTDMENEEERMELFFAKEADTLRFMVEWKAGVQIAFPDQIVKYKNT